MLFLPPCSGPWSRLTPMLSSVAAMKNVGVSLASSLGSWAESRGVHDCARAGGLWWPWQASCLSRRRVGLCLGQRRLQPRGLTTLYGDLRAGQAAAWPSPAPRLPGGKQPCVHYSPASSGDRSPLAPLSLGTAGGVFRSGRSPWVSAGDATHLAAASGPVGGGQPEVGGRCGVQERRAALML